MTVLEASNNILNYFRHNDWATIKNVREGNFNVDQFKKAGDKEELEEVINQTYTLAFKKLTELGYCESISEARVVPDRWVLIKPLDNYSQVIEIDGILAAGIAQVLNELATHFNGEICADATRITTKDLEKLVLAGYELLNQLKGTDGNE